MQQLPLARCPEEAGVSSRGILEYIAARAEAGIEPHALWVLRHGRVACRLTWAPYDDRTPHMLFSLSKSFCSAAAGFAVQEGLLSWDSRVLDVLADVAPEAPSPWLQGVTLHHLLTMGSGLRVESDEIRSGTDWARRALACDCDHAPGTHYHYNSTGTYLVACMVQKVTGLTVRDYLTPRLFVPLGILQDDGSAPDWDLSPDGVNMGGWGLWLSCAQIARFGQCLLQKGRWDGVQVLPREWLDRATVSQIDNGNGEHPHDHDWNMGYGYQFWMCRTDHEPGQTPRYRGDGALSQLCIVDERRDMVVCCVSGVPEIGKSLELMYDHLLAAADMPPADEATRAELQRQLAALAYPWPEHDGSPVPAGEYVTGKGEPVLTIGPDFVTLSLSPEATVTAPIGSTATHGSTMAGCGMQEGTLRLRGRMLNGPFTLEATVRFADDMAEMTIGGIGVDARTALLKRKKHGGR